MRFAAAALALAGALSSAHAQLNLPTCALTCLTSADFGSCGQTDQTCLCNSQDFVVSVGACIVKECPAADAQTAIMGAIALCQQAGVSITLLPSSSAAPPSSTAASESTSASVTSSVPDSATSSSASSSATPPSAPSSTAPPSTSSSTTLPGASSSAAPHSTSSSATRPSASGSATLSSVSGSATPSATGTTNGAAKHGLGAAVAIVAAGLAVAL